jgi:hypothetical protein
MGGGMEDPRAENRTLRRAFRHLGLDPRTVWIPSRHDIHHNNRRLRHLLHWVCAYLDCPDRGKLEKRGYLFPPVEPDRDPDSDWLLFERWIQGQPLTWNLAEEMKKCRPPGKLRDRDVRRNLRKIKEALARRGVVVDLQRDVPRRLVYAYLLQALKEEEFQYAAAGSRLHLTACTGYCPGCFQRPWCEQGKMAKWPEDEKAGRRVFPKGMGAFTKGLRTKR